MKLRYKILFILILFLLLFIINNNKIYAADINLFNNWLEENRQEFDNAMQGYSYVIINNVYRNYIFMYYTNSLNTTFIIKEETPVTGDRRRIISTSLNLEDNCFSYYILNPNNNNTFRLPTGLSTSFSPLINDTSIINNWNENNIILYDNCELIIDDKIVSFEPKLEYIEFIETLDGYFLRTNPLDYNLYGSDFGCDYYLMMYENESETWINSNAEENFITYEISENSYTTGLQLSYLVTIEGEYIFRLQHKDNPELVSNSFTFNLTDFSAAKKYWYDVTVPIYSYGFENNKAIVYTNYLSAEYYDNCLLVYVDNNDDSHVFVSSIISKEYNTDKTMFRFKLEFEEPVSYSCRFVLNGEAGFYYTDTSIFNITESFFVENGYQEEQSFLGMIGDFLKNLFVGIFVPSNGYFESKINELGDKINTKIPYQQYIDDFEQLSEIEAESKDITVSADLASYKISDNLYVEKKDFIDFSIFSKYQEVWFSWIRVVTYIGLAIFNINMFMKFLRGFSLAGVSNISNNNVKGG